MKLASDISSLIEDDIRKLTEAFCTGEISIPGLGDIFRHESVLQRLAADIIRYQLESRMLSLVLPYLSTLKWLSMQEACFYSRKSRNTLLELIKTGTIYGTKPEGSGDYVVDRESIDSYYSDDRNKRRLHLAGRRTL